MPHGGTVGGNIFDGLRYEVKTYFSQEAKKARTTEDKEWKAQKEKAEESFLKFKEQHTN